MSECEVESGLSAKEKSVHLTEEELTLLDNYRSDRVGVPCVICGNQGTGAIEVGIQKVLKPGKLRSFFKGGVDDCREVYVPLCAKHYRRMRLYDRLMKNRDVWWWIIVLISAGLGFILLMANDIPVDDFNEDGDALICIYMFCVWFILHGIIKGLILALFPGRYQLKKYSPLKRLMALAWRCREESLDEPFMSSFVEGLKKYAIFSGRARRKDFLMFLCFWTLNYLCCFFLSVSISQLFNAPASLAAGEIITGGYVAVTLMPLLAVTCRRLHDINKSGRWILIWIALFGIAFFTSFIPNYGNNAWRNFGFSPLRILILGCRGLEDHLFCWMSLAWLLFPAVLLCFDSMPGENRYGQNPKGL